MRVLFVINSLGSGGTERSTAVLLPHLVERGIEPEVAVLVNRSEGDEDSVRDAGIDVTRLHGAGLRAQARSLRRLVRDRRPDVVHTAIFEADMVGRLGAARTGVPVLSSLVNTPYDRARLADPNVSRAKLQAVRALDAASGLALVEHFHAVSEGVARHARRMLGIPSRRITVVERGRDLQALSPPDPAERASARAALDLDDHDEVVLTAGRQEYQKGHVHLVRAVALLARRRPRLVVLVAGREGNASAALAEAVTATGTGRHIRVLGYRSDVGTLLAAADLFALPSVYEGTAGAVLEAWARGVPVVASRLEGLEGIVTEGVDAALVRPADPSALAGALDSLLAYPARREALGAAGRAAVSERFDIARSADRMAGLYRALAGGGAAARRVPGGRPGSVGSPLDR